MSESTSRRGFLKKASAGATAMSALSYARVAGANDRISIGVIGCGGRGIGAHMKGIHAHVETQNIEVTAVCDPWKQRHATSALHEAIWTAFKARGIVIAFPQIDVHLDTPVVDSIKRLAGRAA